jgi:predicted dithiol-disulfide oxidoreductase (DUF899 family)
MAAESQIRFPGESPEYRQARNQLLEAETELRRSTEAVAAMRRELPPGGAVPEDYRFEEGDGDGGSREVKLSDLFEPGKDTLVIYSFMFPRALDDDGPCPSCTSILDALDVSAPHVTQRVNLAVVAKTSLPRILEHAQNRGWRNLRLLSSASNGYNRAYFGEGEDGAQWPILNVFSKDGGEIRHFWGSELINAPVDESMDPRHVDFIWPIWNLFDATPEGRGTGHAVPQLSYD